MNVAGRLTKRERKTVDVEVPGYEVPFRLREMSGTERDTWEAAAVKETVEHVKDEKGRDKVEVRRSVDPMHLRARLVAMCWIDGDGKRVYADDEVKLLGDDLPANDLGVLFEAAQKLNGLDDDAVEVARKNS